MFETSKLPTEQRTVTGNPVSFNTHYALPLDACKISFEATQSGSGDPSPDNVCPISGVDDITLTDNGTAVTIDLDGTRYGGVLDVVTGTMTITDVAYKIRDLAFAYSSTYGRFESSDYSGSRRAPIHNNNIVEGLMCECYISGRATSGSGTDYPDKRVAVAANSSFLFIYDSSYTNVNTMKSAVGDYYVKWKLKGTNYITIQLTPEQISSIIGNNTFSTDTGSLEISFQDLQEKSASGAVATFNTALAMPLASCNIAVNAWQEGSGDPYPEGGTAQRWDEETELGSWNDSSEEWQASTTQLKSKNYIPVLPNTTYHLVNPSNTASRYVFYDINKNYLSWATASSNSNFTTPNDTYYMMFGLATYYGTTYKNDVSINYPATDTSYHSYSNERPIQGFSGVNATRCGVNLWDEEWELGSINNTTGQNTVGTTTYRTKNYIPLNLGVNYYLYIGGADTLGLRFYDINKNYIGPYPAASSRALRWNNEIPSRARFMRFVNVSANTYANDISVNYPSTDTDYHAYTGNTYIIQLGQEVYGAEVDAVNGVAHVTHGYIEFDGREGWVATTVSGFPCFQIARGVLPTSTQFISNYIKRVVAMTASEYIGYVDDSNFNVRFTSDTTLTEFKKVLSYNNMQIVYELATPFDIQLTPTQIAAIQGNNTIFADTGDVDITYKDCDLAKRGDFRQVFKIPD